MKNLVIQGPGLSPEALDTFKVVCMPERITLTKRAARCVAVRDDAETRKAVQGLSDFWKLDNAFVDSKLRLSDFRLLALDMDSTLVNIETLDTDNLVGLSDGDRRRRNDPGSWTAQHRTHSSGE